MRILRTVLSFAVPLAVLAVLPRAADAAQEESARAPLPSAVTAEVLEARIAEVEAAPDLSDEARAGFVDLYRRALSYLGEAKAHASRTAGLEEATRTAPSQTQLIRDEIEASRQADPTAGLSFGSEATREQIEHDLREEEAALSAAQTRRSDFEGRIAYHRDRPTAIDPRLAEAKIQQEEAVAAVRAPAAPGESPTLSQARRWVLETRLAALVAEITSLEQELRSQPLRVSLLEARRDREAARGTLIEARVAALSELVNSRRRLEAEEATAEAEEALRQTAGLHPLLVQLSEANAELTRELNAMSGRLDARDRDANRANKLALQVEADHRDAEATVQAGGVTQELGRLLLEQRESLPDVQLYRRRARDHAAQIATAFVQRLRHQAEARRLVEPDGAVAELEAQLAADDESQLARFRALVAQRQALLERALEADEVDLRQLREVQAAERALLDAVRAYVDFLEIHLLWMQSAPPTRVQDLPDLPEELRGLFAPSTWSDLAATVAHQAPRSPVLWVALLVASGLVWKRRAVISAIEAVAPPLARPGSDSFGLTLRAALLTLAAAAPVSLLLAAVGGQLRIAARGTDLSHAVGSSLLHVALYLYLLRALRILCVPRGLAVAHFRWPEPAVALLRAQLDRVTWILVLSVLLVRLAVDLNPVEMGGTIARLGFLVYAAGNVLFFYRVLHPRRGVLIFSANRRGTWLLRTAPLWWSLLLVFPLALAALALAGYVYTADKLYLPFQNSLWMIGGLVVLGSLGLRWLLVVRRRLAYEAALERRKAVLAAAAEASAPGSEESAALQFDEPEADLGALSDDSRALLDVAMVFAGFFYLFVLWSPLLPALRIFEDVTLWYRTVTVSGEVERLPVTLASLGLALLFALGTFVLARRLPAVLEIILLQNPGLSSGTRYTVATLTRYAIVAAGVALVLGTLGARWAHFQWLVAALGVGIGFGLQEIVANFISGLIILFERPIRVGDIVTVGDVDGVVTRIQIRATTIRGWDRKELIVPNREFVTGRLLNWTLSDQVTRTTVVVGVAYGTDVDRALALMRQAADENEHVLDEPAPILTFEGFGDSALNLILRAYVDSIDHRIATTSALHKSINSKFAEAGIAIAFPQRDLHLDTRGPLRVRLEDGQASDA